MTSTPQNTSPVGASKPLHATEPLCKHFGVCSGCQSQHIAYEQQLRNKKERLAYLFSQHFTGEIATFSASAYGYRNRMDFMATREGLGFRKAEGGGTVRIEHCPISDPRITQALRDVQTWLAATPEIESFDMKRKSGTLKYVVMRSHMGGVALSFMLSEDSTKLSAHVEKIEAFAKTSTWGPIAIAYVPAVTDESLTTEFYMVSGDEYVEEKICNVPILYHVEAFFQNNPRVAEQMVAYVRDAVLTHGGAARTVVDAYGGAGTFGAIIAPLVPQLISIENHPLSSAACVKNIERLGLRTMRAITEDAANLRKLAIPAGSIILVDPPRSGMSDKAIRATITCEPEAIIYVSCNPAQLAKEMTYFSARYRISALALFDMFPHTNHAEAVAILEKK